MTRLGWCASVAFAFAFSLFSTNAHAQGYCGDAICDPADGEDEWSCPDDCGTPTYCGDGTCDADEDYTSCPDDCPLDDLDGDGYDVSSDCDDDDPSVYPGWVAADAVEIEAPVVTLAGDVDSGFEGCTEGGFVSMPSSAGGRFTLRGDVAGIGSMGVVADSLTFARNGVIDDVGEVTIALSGTASTGWQGDVVGCDSVSVDGESLRLNRRAMCSGNGDVVLTNRGYASVAADFLNNDSVSLTTDTFRLNRRASFIGNAACTVAGTQLNSRALVGCTLVP